MSFSDDDPILVSQDDLGKPPPFPGGKTKLRVINKEKAPLEQTKLKVLLELIGSGSKGDKIPGADIVAVLDVSGSMADDGKLEKLKSAMQYVIKKLSPAQRLSIVIFSNAPQRICRLRQMTENAQTEIGDLVNGLRASGKTNIAGGLRTALQVLEERKVTSERVAAIMLMSDGDQSRKYEDARNVPVSEVPVFTFGFGRCSEYNPEVLNDIAKHSKGGTFSVADIESTDSDPLSIAFSQCLAGLLTVIVQDLKLTIIPQKVHIGDGTAPPIEPKIEKVEAGNYPQTEPDATGSITVAFGEIYNQETRKVMLDLVLPAVHFQSDTGTLILKIAYQYIFGTQTYKAPIATVSVIRTSGTVDEENPEVVDEDKRIETVDKMGRATNLADQNNFPEAQNELKQAQDSLDMVKPSNLIEMLKYEVGQLLEFMQSPILYKSKGKHFALAALTSHAFQRFAARGDPTKLRLFSTPAMDYLLEEVQLYIKDPTDVSISPVIDPVVTPEPVPVNNNPIDLESLSNFLGTAIQSLQGLQDALQGIQSLLNASRP